MTRRHPAIGALAVLLSLPAQAATIGFDEAMTEVSRAPDVVAADRGVQAKRRLNERISEAVSNPQLSGGAGVNSPGGLAGSINGQVGLAQGWNLSGVSATRRQAATQEERVLKLLSSSTRLERQLSVALSWLNLWIAEQALEAARDEAELAAKFLDRIEHGAALKAFIGVDVSEASAYLSEAALAAIAAEGDLFEGGLDLARRLGRPQVEPLRCAGNLPNIPEPERLSAEALTALARRMPRVVALEQSVQAETLREAELYASRGWQVQAGTQLTYDTSTGPGAQLVGTVTMPLFDRGERERGTLAAEVERLRGEYEQTLADATGDLASVAHEVVHTQEVVDELTSHGLPALRAAARQREALLNAGEGSIVEWLLARRALVAGQSRMARARAMHVHALWHWRLLADAAVATEDRETGRKP